MNCNKCYNGCNSCICTCSNTCTPAPDCSCAILLKSDCVNNVTEDLECSGILKGQTLSEVLVQLDAYICEKFETVANFLQLVNIGAGAEIYKGVSGLGQRELRSLVDSALINIVEGTDEIVISVDETALNTFIEANQKTYTAANIGTGAQVYKNSTVAGDITTFNIRKVNTSNSGTGASVLKTEVENTNDISIIARKLKSSTLTISQGTDEISIESPETATIQGLYVNNLYTPSYEDYLNLDNLGKGEGTLAKPFTDTTTYASPVAPPVIVPNTAILNALSGNPTNSYVGAGTRLAPALSGQTIIVQNNIPNLSYTYVGNLNYANLNLKLEANVLSTTTGFLLDLEDATGFDQTSAGVTINIADGKVLQIQGDGLKNNGNVIATTTYSTGKIVNLIGGGLIFSETNDITKYLINTDTLDAGNNNDGNLTFSISCKLRADFQGVYRVGGLGKIDLYNTVTSGTITNTVNVALKAFHQTGGQVRAFDNSVVAFYGGTRTDAITFTPSIGFTPIFIGAGSKFEGSAINLFTKTTTDNVTLQVSGSQSGYTLIVTDVFNSPNLWNVVFTNNVIQYGTINITKADLTFGNISNAINTVNGYIIESLRFFTSKESARLSGIPTNSAYLVKRTVAATDLIVNEEYLVDGAGDIGTVGEYILATGAETTGTGLMVQRNVMV